MAQPTMGPAVLAWKISQYPQYWIPLICIFIGAGVGIYFLIPAMIGDPMPDPAQVTEMFISWDASGKESSFKKIPHEQYYRALYECTSTGFASTKTPGAGIIATVRINTADGKSTLIKFFDSDLITVNGKCYDRARPYMFLEMVEGMRHGY